ncbi:ABC-three component system middle component 5 [uncultured Nonlabens sp.]|uniref:ABC-three component system middle component 5 n=1 Tax=uncultured Nonlabens sp. TaxID=859306 RepID=UPI00262B16F0|nr:ABC-three component system middle component 5 [uncultured Nonlabens sp.]
MILNKIESDQIDFERLRILDFYLAHPFEISNFRFGTLDFDRQMKSLFPRKINPYQNLRNPKKLFIRMNPYQQIAIKRLASYGLIEIDFTNKGSVTVKDKNSLSTIIQNMEINLSVSEQNALNVACTYFFFMSYYGNNGLKSRSGLIEFKYDAQQS